MEFKFLEFKDLSAFAGPEQLATIAAKHLDLLRTNPLVSDDFPSIFYFVDGDGKLACHFLSSPDLATVDGVVYNWTWSGDLFTCPDYRGKGLASQLVKKQVDLLHDRNIGWGGVFSTPTAIHLYEKQDFYFPGRARRLMLMKTIKPFLSARVSSPGIRKISDFIYKSGFRMIAPFIGFSTSNSKISLRPSDVLSQEFTRIASQIKYPERAHFDDSPAMLKWKSKVRSADQFYIVSKRSLEEDLCYFAARSRYFESWGGTLKNVQLLTISDFGFFVPSRESSEALIDASLCLFRESSADILEVISSSQVINAFAKRRGMLSLGTGMSFKYKVPHHWNWPRLTANDWHLTHYRGDAFSFP